jgi:hemerythrin-like domain-containing protein
MTAVPAPTNPDVTEMTAVHRVFRNTFATAPRFVGGVKDGDTERAAIVGGYLANVLELLRVHHDGEDELMFPKLVDRSADPELVRRIAAEHHDLDAALPAATAAISAWVADGSTDSGDAVLAALKDLEVALVPHLDHEEEAILPLVSEHISVEEWDELPGHAMQTFQGDNLFLILGLVRDEFTQEQRDRMLEGMPPPAVEAWRTVGIDAYKASVAQLIGAPVT